MNRQTTHAPMSTPAVTQGSYLFDHKDVSSPDQRQEDLQSHDPMTSLFTARRKPKRIVRDEPEAQPEDAEESTSNPMSPVLKHLSDTTPGSSMNEVADGEV